MARNKRIKGNILIGFIKRTLKNIKVLNRLTLKGYKKIKKLPTFT